MSGEFNRGPGGKKIETDMCPYESTSELVTQHFLYVQVLMKDQKLSFSDAYDEHFRSRLRDPRLGEIERQLILTGKPKMEAFIKKYLRAK